GCEKDTAPALALDGNFWLAHHLLGECYSAEKRYDDAEREFGLALTGSRRGVFTLSAYGRHLVRAGKNPEAQKMLAEIDERAAKEYVAPVLRAKVHFALGNFDEGFKWMSKALDERDHGLAFLAADRDFDGVRKDPRFVALLRSVGLTEALSSWK